MASPLIDYVALQLSSNREQGTKPDSWRGLAKVLSELTGYNQSNWEDRLKDYRRGTTPNEATVDQLAQALGVARGDMPQVKRLRLRDHDRRLDVLEETVRVLSEELLALRREVDEVRRADGGSPSSGAGAKRATPRQ